MNLWAVEHFFHQSQIRTLMKKVFNCWKVYVIFGNSCSISLVFSQYTMQILFIGDPLGTARVSVPLIHHQWRQWWWWRRYIPFLRPASPAQWRPFSVVYRKLQISLVGKLLFSWDRLWSFVVCYLVPNRQKIQFIELDISNLA